MASIVFDSRHARTARESQSMIAIICSAFPSAGDIPDMLHATHDLRDIVEAVAVGGDKSIIVCGEPVATLSHKHGVEAVSSPLANALYRLLYCRPLRRTNGHWPDARAGYAALLDAESPTPSTTVREN